MILVNGEPSSVIDARDRGFQYGDGLFETVAVIHGRPRLWNLHLARLADGCARLGFDSPAPDVLLIDLQRLAAGETCVIKFIVTRGPGGRGYRPAGHQASTRVAQRSPWPENPTAWHTDGIAVRLCGTRLAIQPALAGMKHLNRLEQVLARREWDDPAIPEGLMLDSDGHIVCGTQSNLFLRRGAAILTPSLDRCGVRGVMRTAVIDAARAAGEIVSEARITARDLEDADEVFLTSALIGAWPVAALGDRHWSAGPTARRVQGWIASW